MIYEELRQLEKIKVYSLQQPKAVELIFNSDVYVPPLYKSSHFDERYAYKWMAIQFKIRMNRYPKGNLFWINFDKEKLERYKKENDRLLTFCIPVHEILCSLYLGWMNYVRNPLNKIILEKRLGGINISLSDLRFKRKIWNNIFACHGYNVKELQGVLDHIKKEWVIE